MTFGLSDTVSYRGQQYEIVGIDVRLHEFMLKAKDGTILSVRKEDLNAVCPHCKKEF